MSWASACVRCHWDLRWASHKSTDVLKTCRNRERCEGCVDTSAGTHAEPATEAFGGAFYGSQTV
eukprot:4981313-Pyramimonas_sp.AAC.1